MVEVCTYKCAPSLPRSMIQCALLEAYTVMTYAHAVTVTVTFETFSNRVFGHKVCSTSTSPSHLLLAVTTFYTSQLRNMVTARTAAATMKKLSRRTRIIDHNRRTIHCSTRARAAQNFTMPAMSPTMTEAILPAGR